MLISYRKQKYSLQYSPFMRSSAEILELTSMHVSSVFIDLSTYFVLLVRFSSLTTSSYTENDEIVLRFFCELLVLNLRFF